MGDHSLQDHLPISDRVDRIKNRPFHLREFIPRTVPHGALGHIVT
jgi:hypothetical protein